MIQVSYNRFEHMFYILRDIVELTYRLVSSHAAIPLLRDDTKICFYDMAKNYE